MRIILMGVTEAAKFLGIHTSRVSSMNSKGLMPKPLTKLACGPIWTKTQLRKVKGRV